MNRLDVRNLVIDATGRTDKDTQINRALNIALNKISSEFLWNDLLTEASAVLTIGAASVALASNTRRLSEIRLIDGLNTSRIVVRPKTWVVKFFPSPTSMANGKPRYGYLQGTTLFLVPPSDTADTITYSYYRLHADILNDTTVLSIPQADEAVVAYTTYWVFKSLEKHEDAERWFGDYLTHLRDAKRVDRDSVTEQIPTPRGISDPLPGDYWLNPFIGRVPGYPYY